MIHFPNQFSQDQFKRWHKKALAGQKQIENLQGEIDYFLGLPKGWIKDKDLRAQYNEKKVQLESVEWAKSWLHYINNWLISDGVVVLNGAGYSVDNGFTSEFIFCYYNRPFDDYGRPLSDAEIFSGVCEREEPFRYNGGLINHGTTESPRWSVHT